MACPESSSPTPVLLILGLGIVSGCGRSFDSCSGHFPLAGTEISATCRPWLSLRDSYKDSELWNDCECSRPPSVCSSSPSCCHFFSRDFGHVHRSVTLVSDRGTVVARKTIGRVGVLQFCMPVDTSPEAEATEDRSRNACTVYLFG